MYKAYLTKSLEQLADEIYIGTFDTQEEAFKAAYKEHKNRGYCVEPYSRGILNPDGLYYDVGDWSHFIAILYV